MELNNSEQIKLNIGSGAGACVDMYDDDISDDNDENFDEPEMEIFDEVLCLFCDLKLPNAIATLEHCSAEHNIDIVKSLKEISHISYLNFVKFVNFVRMKFREHNSSELKANFKELLNEFVSNIDNDSLLKPVLEDDQFLCFDIEQYVEGIQPECVPESVSNGESSGCDEKFLERQVLESQSKDFLVSEILKLRQQLLQAESVVSESQFRIHTMTGLVQRLTTEDDDECIMQVEKTSSQLDEVNKPAVDPKNDKAGFRGGTCKEISIDDPDFGYFDSYDSLSIHEEMIQDKIRTESYRKFIIQNQPLFKEKRVLDLGCGTGILSLFSASAGAKRVYAIDQSNVAKIASQVVKENNLAETIIVLQGKAENVRLPFDNDQSQKIDVIISEWMGYFLLFECMLDSVIWARDHFTVLNGGAVPQVYPRFYSLWLCALDDLDLHNQKLVFWDDVYGFKMSCVRDCLCKMAAVKIVKPQVVCSDNFCISEIDAQTVNIGYSDFETSFKLKANRSTKVTAICGYFDVQFGETNSIQNNVSFSTSPDSPTTHWQQVVFVLQKPVAVSENSHLKGTIHVKRDCNDPRSLKITIKTDLESTEYCLK